jgi:hypothetical protein
MFKTWKNFVLFETCQAVPANSKMMLKEYTDGV